MKKDMQFGTPVIGVMILIFGLGLLFGVKAVAMCLIVIGVLCLVAGMLE